MKIIKAILSAAMVLALAGCAKVSPECELIVMPRLMTVPSSPLDGAAYMVRVYVFYGVGSNYEEDDTVMERWEPGSYANADAGMITNKETGEMLSWSLVGMQGEDNYVHIGITSSPVMLVAIDPAHRFYAYRAFKYEIPLPKVSIPVRFQLWRRAEPYMDSGWRVVSEYSELNPPEQEEEETESSQNG